MLSGARSPLRIIISVVSRSQPILDRQEIRKMHFEGSNGLGTLSPWIPFVIRLLLLRTCGEY